MKLHEFQAKKIFSENGILVPEGEVVRSGIEAVSAAHRLGGRSWIVKAQVHTGGRGKVGGVFVVNGIDELKEKVHALLGSRLITKQTGKEGLPVNMVLIEKPIDIGRELYLSLLIDRSIGKTVFITSEMGGMNIEEVAKENPSKIRRVSVENRFHLQFQDAVRDIFSGLSLMCSGLTDFRCFMDNLYDVFQNNDASLIEINPLVVSKCGKFIALDAKMIVDDSAFYRHEEWEELRDETQENTQELLAARHGLNYVPLDGDIACIVNGAGLAMATMDLIKLHGGNPANFLDVGGGVTEDSMAEALKIILSNKKVKVILINIFGGIVRCDIVAEGVLKVINSIDINIPLVVRLEGTNKDAGCRLLTQASQGLVIADDMQGAVERAILLAKGGS